MVSNRYELMEQWLRQQFPSGAYTLAPASSDASFRRYFRVTLDHDTFIVMDAPPEHENCVPFIQVSALFLAAGAHVPEVLAQDLEKGFLLLTDLGNTTYLSVLDATTAPRLYGDANEALVKIQLASRPGVLPPYDSERLLTEMRLFPQWYLARHLNMPPSPQVEQMLEETFATINANVLAQPQVYVHRDYHSRNLMVTETDNPGVLDFQDAVYGAITYDLVSLYKDAYISWDEEQVLDWVIRYWEKAKAARLPVAQDFGDFYRDFEWMGIQRHLKVLGIFARLYHRDGKDGYLKDLPLVKHYLRQACKRYREFGPLVRLLDQLDAQA